MNFIYMYVDMYVAYIVCKYYYSVKCEIINNF